ncbi:calcium/sodium antiporter [Natronorubrum texcoconense]|uniref:Cation:H+ antiporter n=1 Tax=Natronorubrum texcoconense TaxID=1095776 RepID=A0A1G8UPD1_9EURY|nr:calcium/sodium antiporter [Natronorubrum texcoconense]SDJ55589.1 cation:H+ antiporter [Natronorubrum texcoconense]
MGVLESVALLVVGTAALWLGAAWLVAAASKLAESVGISPLVVGLTVVAFGTSAPEIAVSTTAALEGQSDVAVGNVVGSNVFNLGVILGLVAVLAPFRVTTTLLRRDALVMAGATVVAALVLADQSVSRLEGALLLVLLLGYLVTLGVAIRRSSGTDSSTEADSSDGGAAIEEDGEIEEIEAIESPEIEAIGGTADENGPVTDETATADDPVRFGRESVRLLVGLALVVVGGRVLVTSATTIALSLGISPWLVGVTIVAGGTSLPELVTSVVATRRGGVAIAAGNIIGSNVFNCLGVLGLAAVVRPMTVDPAVFPGVVWLVALTAVATGLLATGRRVTRLEGALLVAIGVSYWVATAVS